jgi:hypothetical protein
MTEDIKEAFGALSPHERREVVFNLAHLRNTRADNGKAAQAAVWNALTILADDLDRAAFATVAQVRSVRAISLPVSA